MTTVQLAVAWAVLLLFVLLGNWIVWRLLKERGRTDLMWVSVMSNLIPVGLFTVWPSPYTLMAFPLIQSVGLLVLQRLVNQQK